MVIAAGTSVAACLPAFIAASITGTCHSHGVAVNTRSRSSTSHKRSKSRGPRAYIVGAGCPAAVIALFADIAHRRDPAAGNLEEVIDVTAALQTNAHDANPDELNGCNGCNGCIG